MKKKVLFGLGAIAIAVVLTFNVSIAKSSNSSGLDLNVLSSVTTAQAEDPGCIESQGWVFCCRWYINGCYYTNALTTRCPVQACN